MEFFTEEATTEQALDIIDLSFRLIVILNKNPRWKDAYNIVIESEAAIEELNRRFLEHGLGHSCLSGDEAQLIRKDNEHLHQDAVLPALQLLHEEGFNGANDEYRNAQKHTAKVTRKNASTTASRRLKAR